jgi:hypothetical protein
MDDERIRQLSEEVLAAVRGAPAERESTASIEARLSALEAAVRRIEATGAAMATATAYLHRREKSAAARASGAGKPPGAAKAAPKT